MGLQLLQGRAQLQCDTYIAIRRRAVTRFAVKKLIKIMSEVARRRKRAWIKPASHICVAMDDKAPYRLLRFKLCFGVQSDAQEEPCVTGVLGLLTHGGALSSRELKYLDEDYSARMAE